MDRLAHGRRDGDRKFILTQQTIRPVGWVVKRKMKKIFFLNLNGPATRGSLLPGHVEGGGETVRSHSNGSSGLGSRPRMVGRGRSTGRRAAFG
jgi:hypothetical protein